MNSLHDVVLHLPIVTTILSALFCIVLFSRYAKKTDKLASRHLFWWGLGMATYGLGTLTEASTTLFGWSPIVFRLWYVAGAFLGGYPLAQGSLYLLTLRRPGATRFAEWSARVVPSILAVAAVLVFLSPLDLTKVETHRLSGSVLAWTWLRWISPWINIYSAAFLIGGAVVSAMRFRRLPEERHRYLGNILIAIGALLPGIGGSMTRAGYVEALYVTELLGLILIYLGYRKCLTKEGSATLTANPRAAASAALVAFCLLGFSTVARADEPPKTAEPAATSASESKDSAAAESVENTKPDQSFFASTTVTALGRETPTFEIATPVTVVPIQEIERRMPQNPAQLLLDQPGVDVNGVGPNQQRPVIRGQRGLRVLFLEDGLRLNNPRRQSDFGEITGLSDLDAAAAVEVVRGPASVLYGSDAIGGVLNLITRHPHPRDGHVFGGSAEGRGFSAGNGWRAGASVEALMGKTDFQLGGSYRDAGEYSAPSGTFGKIRLAEDTKVQDSGVTDRNVWGTVGYAFDDRHSLRLRLSDYHATDAGFGIVDPTLLEDQPQTNIRILYPRQEFQRGVVAYNGGGLGSMVADSVEAKLYHQKNARVLVNNIGIDIGPLGPGFPHSAVQADTRNDSTLKTDGLRAEAIKLLDDRNTLTYGAEVFRDLSRNTDFSTTTTTLRFPFPPFQQKIVSTDAVANAPNATNSSWGVFVQDELALERLTVTGGLRYQETKTAADSTPGWDTSNLDFDGHKLVGSINATWQIMPELNALVSYGTAFRAPSIIERLFNGATPEGTGFQILNPDLTAEASKNWDIGVKYLRHDAFMELVAFRSDIANGIVQYFLSPAEIAALPPAQRLAIQQSRAQFVVQQRNADHVRYQGLELSVGYRFAQGVTVGGNFTDLDSKRFDATNPPTGDTYSQKIVAYTRWEPQSGRFWLEYRLRHNASKKADLDPNQPVPPVGTVLPSFTVHSLAGGVTLFEREGLRHSLQLEIDNLTNGLYAEFSNASFFRPQPKRNLTASYRIRF